MSPRGIGFLGIVFLAYLILFIVDPGKTIAALKSAGNVAAALLPILFFVSILTALINFFIHPGVLAKHLGHKSGMRGWFIALTAGILSHGPMYAWYSMIEDLRRHGMRDGLIAAFFYARAIKLPLLPLMVAYFGLDFTVILSCLTILAAWGQGVAIDRLGQES